MPEAQKTLPKYRSHKEFWALEIAEIKLNGPNIEYGAMLIPARKDYAPFEVDCDYLFKHQPEVGGYFVLYKDGYKSFSPKEAFEDGNEEIKNVLVNSEDVYPSILNDSLKHIAETRPEMYMSHVTDSMMCKYT